MRRARENMRHDKYYGKQGTHELLSHAIFILQFGYVGQMNL